MKKRLLYSLKIAVAGLMLCSISSGTALAGTRQATVRVSCTILPILELQSIKKAGMAELKKPAAPSYLVQESSRDNNRVKLYSVTML